MENSMAASGILMHISSLPSKYGVGTFGDKAYKFIDFLKRSGQKFWQVLPLNPIDSSGSPYKPYSTFAGNINFIDLDILKDEGIIKEKDYSLLDWGNDEESLDFSKVSSNRLKVLNIAYNSWKDGKEKEIEEFIEKNRWAKYYSCFMILLEENNYRNFWEWENNKNIDEEIIIKIQKEKEDRFNFWVFTQIKFYNQWFKLRKYANENGIKIIGDMPFYVSENSADVWSNPEIFSLNEDLSPKYIGGCPPDAFAITGQRWGMPTYNWIKLKETGYYWWIERIKAYFKNFDIIRLDHFRGFDSFYEIDSKEETAKNGVWVKGPGIVFFEKVKKELGEVEFIAEDLGFITDSVIELVKKTKFAGMQVLQVDGSLKTIKNSVSYIGTHDNDTAVGWYNSLNSMEKEKFKKILNIKGEDDINWQIVEALMKSNSKLVIHQMQDILGLSSKARMNIPGTAGGINWKWRIRDEFINKKLEDKLLKVTIKYNRTCSL